MFGTCDATFDPCKFSLHGNPQTGILEGSARIEAILYRFGDRLVVQIGVGFGAGSGQPATRATLDSGVRFRYFFRFGKKRSEGSWAWHCAGTHLEKRIVKPVPERVVVCGERICCGQR